MNNSDHELMRRCRDGDMAAFEQLVRRWEGPVARILARLGQPSSEAEDLAQEVFLRVLDARGRYRACGAFSTWLYRITLNVARSAARRRRWQWRSLDNHEPAAAEAAPPETLGREELGRRVQQALASLPAKLREPLVLRHFGELTFAEIAQITGQPASTVKSRTRVALEKLRGELHRRGIDEKELE
ncbi:MAG: sigma-70 family RNA polymerase sigma factor, partial [Planctomycetes bacterium]|nr:sigma-70 family RNA polymerase sigma factor [Planctomycetota bacterium]